MASARKAVKTAKPVKSKAKAVPKTNGKSNGKALKTSRKPDVANADPELFDPLTPGEVADALRTLTEDRRLSTMAKVGRYRVICTEPLVVKPPHWMANHRLARIVAYDYAADRTVDATVDLDAGVVAHLDINTSQPMLSRDEEMLAIEIARDSSSRDSIGWPRESSRCATTPASRSTHASTARSAE